MNPTHFDVSARVHLTPTQHCILSTVRRMQDGPDEYGHDAEGDLSLWSGNLTRTLRVLRRRGLIEPDYEVREPDMYFTNVRITEAGRRALP